MARYLLLSGSYGNGHNAAKDALKVTLLRDPTNEVQEMDMIQLVKRADKKQKTSSDKKKSTPGLLFIESFPLIWDAFYSMLDMKMSADVIREALNLYFKNFIQKQFDKTVLTFNPDYIIATYPLWSTLIKNHAQKYGCTATTAVVPTDAGGISLSWYFDQDQIDAFFVIDHITAQTFKDKFGHTKENVYVSFFPIASEHFSDKETFGPNRFMMLLSGLKEDFVVKFLDLVRFQLYFNHIDILQGRDPALFKKLKKRYSDKRFHFWEFLNVKEHLPETDIFIGKPGGATMSECIAQDTLLIAPYYIPGQEEGNIYFMQKTGSGIYEDDAMKLVHYLDILDYRKILDNFHKVKHKNSAKFVLETLKKIRNEKGNV